MATQAYAIQEHFAILDADVEQVTLYCTHCGTLRDVELAWVQERPGEHAACGRCGRSSTLPVIEEMQA